MSSDNESHHGRKKKKPANKRQKEVERNKVESGDANSDKLTLGHILTMLDGGSETPGRIVIM